ncbi:IclR family transcriptional regulator [Spirosoma aureum]|uniref:IclR family transcriptional regulator n=1 Tax=Spirosoma aureum TaxID=2692134 RepID=A0A6G9AN41_9BACT|nr:IclR family transcriptional regulator [Spirosoma aureum]QIP13877.1 IclR family transcriptional regulator [Spirosoma aureum]
MKEVNEKSSPNEKEDGSKYHVPNLERALQLLELLAKHPSGLGLSEISNLLNFPNNSTFRIAMTLLDFGYLNRDEASKQFTLSGKLLSLGYAAVSDQNLVEKSLDVMRALRDTVKETVLLGVINQEEGIVLEQVSGSYPVKFLVDPGHRFCLHVAAPAKAILAFLPESVQHQVCKNILFKPFNERTITNLTDLRAVLNLSRDRGYAVDHGEELESLHCIAAPIFDRHGYPIAAIWTTGPAERMPDSEFPALGKVVIEHARRISQRLGYYPAQQPV